MRYQVFISVPAPMNKYTPKTADTTLSFTNLALQNRFSVDELVDQVSRSFSLSLNVVPKAMRPSLKLAFLLCKTADTVADTLPLTPAERLTALKSLKKIMTTFPLEENLLQVFEKDLELLPPPPDRKETHLLQHFRKITRHLLGLSKTEQALIQKVVLSVTEGMLMDIETFGESKDTLKAFDNTDQLDRYTQWVAGEPGRFWSQVCLAMLPKLQIKNRDEWIQDGIQLGMGLQMVNILRDMPNDIEKGRCYIPQDLLTPLGLQPETLALEEMSAQFLHVYAQLIQKTKTHLEKGLAYVVAIPKREWRCRAAAWWPLVIGLQTLKKIEETGPILKVKQPVKIKRRMVYGEILLSMLILPWNILLRRRFRHLSELV